MEKNSYVEPQIKVTPTSKCLSEQILNSKSLSEKKSVLKVLIEINYNRKYCTTSTRLIRSNMP